MDSSTTLRMTSCSCVVPRFCHFTLNRMRKEEEKSKYIYQKRKLISQVKTKNIGSILRQEKSGLFWHNTWARWLRVERGGGRVKEQIESLIFELWIFISFQKACLHFILSISLTRIYLKCTIKFHTVIKEFRNE